MHARVANCHFLALVEVPDADQDGVRRQHLRRERADLRELGRLGTKQRRERHPMHVAGQRGCRRVHVAMRVDPQQPDRQLLRLASPFGGRCHRSRAETVIAAEHHWHRPFVERSQRRLIELLADLGDVADVLFALVAQLLRLGNRRWQIAFVDDRVAECGEPFSEPGYAERRRSHVDTAPAAAKVERHADDVDGFHASI